MNTKGKAASGANRSGSNQNYNFAGGKNQGFDVYNFMTISGARQCKKCGSDYMKFSKDGYCQRCQQRCEFILREFPHIAREVEQMRGAIQI
jgi:hypothetical protein